MSLIALEQIKFKELAKAVGLLNASGLLKTKINTVGVTKETIVKTFVDAVVAIPDDEKTGEWKGPKEVAEYFNTIVIEDEAASAQKESTKPPKTKPERAEPKQKAEPKQAKPKKKSRATQIAATIVSSKDGTEFGEIINAANDAYVKEGGKNNLQETEFIFGYIKAALVEIGFITISDHKIFKVL